MVWEVNNFSCNISKEIMFVQQLPLWAKSIVTLDCHCFNSFDIGKERIPRLLFDLMSSLCSKCECVATATLPW